MRRTGFTHFILCLVLAGLASPHAGQSVAATADLEQVSGRVESYMREKRPGWKHERVSPATPPGGQPSRDVVVHFWSSEKCLTAGLSLDGVSYGTQPVPCTFKLAIDQTPSATEARTRLSDFVLNQRDADPKPCEAGDKCYVWNGSHVVFVKGRFTFWLSGGVDLRVGDFTVNRMFAEKLAKDIAGAVAAT
jgi:hypothetical protein